VTPGEEIHRLKLTIHYDGTGFHGWQAQAVQRTVQGELEAALERLTGRPGTVVGSGRTDTGVHATGQVASVDLPVRWSPAELRRAMNAVLPGDVWIAAARRVGWRFHPRFHATARTYEYRLDQARGRRPPSDLEALLEESDPELRTSRPAPPEGLFLVRVEYPPDVERPERGDAAADGI
jgi:tRNA pseudouridine(38-40) synthase